MTGACRVVVRVTVATGTFRQDGWYATSFESEHPTELKGSAALASRAS